VGEAAGWALVGAALLLGCSKSSEEPAGRASTRVLPGADPVAPQATETTPTGSAPRKEWAHDAVEWDGTPGFTTVYQVFTVDSSTTQVDPDDAVVQAARASGASCFAGLQEGPDMRSATIQVTVVPSGSVSRAEVSGASEVEVRDCLKRVGSGLHFSAKEGNMSEGIRSFSIDIHVTRAH
jgi:hypothetical protein